MSNNKINVLLVDDHAIVRAGFRLLLATTNYIEVAGEAERGESACQLYQKLSPDVVVLDLSMPGIGGLETLRRLISRDANAKVLVFSVHNEAVYVNRALAAGAKGYISKSSAPDILVSAIQAIAKGSAYVEQGLLATAQQLPADGYKSVLAQLSPREFDIFLLLAKGLTTQKIAIELCLGYKTVANYATQIKSKLHVASFTELTHIAISTGLIKSSQAD